MPGNRNVRIVATPGGEAPLDVRSEWVGLTLPVFGPGRPATTETLGIVTGDLKPPMTGFLVDGRQAVGILAEKSPGAASWWLERAPHVVVDGYLLVFSVDVCEVV